MCDWDGGKHMNIKTDYRFFNWLRSSFHTYFHKLNDSKWKSSELHSALHFFPVYAILNVFFMLDINSWILSNWPAKRHNQTVSVSCCFFQVVISYNWFHIFQVRIYGKNSHDHHHNSDGIILPFAVPLKIPKTDLKS